MNGSPFQWLIKQKKTWVTASELKGLTTPTSDV